MTAAYMFAALLLAFSVGALIGEAYGRRAAWEKVRGYASRTSVAPGESFELFVSTKARSICGLVGKNVTKYQTLGWRSKKQQSNRMEAPWTAERGRCRDKRRIG